MLSAANWDSGVTASRTACPITGSDGHVMRCGSITSGQSANATFEFVKMLVVKSFL